MREHYDLIILGAGLVGASLACALSSHDLKVAIIDRYPQGSEPQTNPDVRPLSLSCGSQRILQTLGIWPALSHSACPIKSVQLSYHSHFAGITFNASDYQVPALGYVVPLHVLLQQLSQQGLAASNITYIQSNEITDVSIDDSLAKVTFESHQGIMRTVEGQLLVGCDGAHSICRNKLSIAVNEHDNGDFAHLFELSMTQAHQGDALQRWTNKGSLALLPLFDRMQRRMVWGANKNVHALLDQWNEQQLVEHVNEIFSLKIGPVAAIKKIGSYPLKTMTAQQQITNRCVLLGNAAHIVYPLTAQGYNLGLKEVAFLAQEIVTARQQQQDIGAASVLEHYLSQVSQDQHFVTKFTQGFHFISSLDVPFIKPLRSMGLLSMDLLPPLKAQFAKRLMGLQGHLSKLACGIPLATKQREIV